MARKVIGGEQVIPKKDNERKQMLDSLKNLSKPVKKVTLFKTKLPKLTQAETEYVSCVEALTNSANDVNISIRQVCSFFAVQYRNFYKSECLDYNYFNANKVFLNVKSELSFNSNYELLEFIALSFIRFENVKNTLNLTDKRLHVSTYRQAWILNELNGTPSQKFAGFY